MTIRKTAKAMAFFCRNRLVFLLLITLININNAVADFTVCDTCECKWLSGQKGANCSGRQLSKIPDRLSSDIQILNLENNEINEIPVHAFENVGLNNIQKLNMKNCNLMSIHKDGFSGLRILIEMDLSYNQLRTLHRDVFIHTERIRSICINNNYIKELEDGLFSNLTYLQKVELSNNRIHKIGLRTFQYLPRITYILLNNNSLVHMPIEIAHSNLQLTGLDLSSNPWRCDCYLQKLRDLVIKKNWYTSPTACNEPERNRNRQWIELNSTEFACKPNIQYPKQGITVEHSVGDNVTLTCKVIGNPLPEVNWKLGTRLITGETKRHGDQRYVIREDVSDDRQWVNLSITNVKYNERGEYTCIAKNPGGKEERIISLLLSKNPSPPDSTFGSVDMINLYIGLAVGIIILLVIVALLCFCFCRKRSSKRHAKSDMHSSNGEALIEGSVIEMQKSLITTVNPVTKPPRRYDAPLSYTSSATEMSDLNKTLLDHDSVYAGNDIENKSMEYVESNVKRPRDSVSVDSIRTEGKAYPPDLLSFPPRGGQTSPAASMASTIPDSSRLPPQAHSPLNSTIYMANPNMFKTLPHNRSQSPFTSPMSPPVITPRQGYVTIPRRPRIPSWSSTASSMISPRTAEPEILEPVYDNLGVRRSARGNSDLSINKTGLEPSTPTQQYPATMRGRPLPATPTGYQVVPLYEEHEPPAPNVRYRSPLSPSIGEPQEPVFPKSIRGKDIPEKSFSPVPSLTNGSLYDSLPNSGTLGRSGKVPPRPPPKPTKKSTSQSNGPLFEDEGEDGTEV